MKHLIKKFNLPNYLKGDSFAADSKRITKAIRGEKNENSSREDIDTEQEMLGRLRDAQEFVKGEQQSVENTRELAEGGNVVEGAAGLVEMGAELIPIEQQDSGRVSEGAMAAKGLAKGAATGAVMGSAIPVVGTAVGAVVGGVIGGAAGLVKGNAINDAVDEKEVGEAKDAFTQVNNKQLARGGYRTDPPTRQELEAQKYAGIKLPGQWDPKGAYDTKSLVDRGDINIDTLKGVSPNTELSRTVPRKETYPIGTGISNDINPLEGGISRNTDLAGNPPPRDYSRGFDGVTKIPYDGVTALTEGFKPDLGLPGSAEPETTGSNSRTVRKKGSASNAASIVPSGTTGTEGSESIIPRSIDLSSVKGTKSEVNIDDDPTSELIGKNNVSDPYSNLDIARFKYNQFKKDNKGKGAELLRGAPLLQNALQLKNLKAPAFEGYDRLTSKYKKTLVDEEALQNKVRESSANTRSAILGASGGSGASASANLLATQLNATKGLSDAYLQAENVNRGESQVAQQFDLSVEQTNLGQSNREIVANAQNKGAFDTQKSKIQGALAEDIGKLGKEELFKKYPELMGLDFDALGKFIKAQKTQTT
jgi:hypothetical protein